MSPIWPVGKPDESTAVVGGGKENGWSKECASSACQRVRGDGLLGRRRGRAETVNLGKSRITGIVGPKWGCHPRLFVPQRSGWGRFENRGLTTTAIRLQTRPFLLLSYQALHRCRKYSPLSVRIIDITELPQTRRKGGERIEASSGPNCLSNAFLSGAETHQYSIGSVGPRGWKDNTMPFDTRGGVTTSHRVAMMFGREASHGSSGVYQMTSPKSTTHTYPPAVANTASRITTYLEIKSIHGHLNWCSQLNSLIDLETSRTLKTRKARCCDRNTEHRRFSLTYYDDAGFLRGMLESTFAVDPDQIA
ncbi:hypothetical protein EDB86DRAFT_3245433 [Lactarius hatsudake]|nr:hypothetical protein EDB86DRAFT_3245433 [Lactarius hatsudake]